MTHGWYFFHHGVSSMGNYSKMFALLLKQDSKESGYSTMLDFTGTDNSSSLDEHWGGARPKIRSALLDVSTAEVYNNFATDNSYKFTS